MGSKPSVSKSKTKLQDNKKEHTDNTQTKETDTSPYDPDTPKDVMISYSHQDKEIMAKLRESLEKNGISVWVDVAGLQAGVDFLGKIGKAILDAKVLISLLSVSTVKSKYCQDEVALAYISDKPILPIAISTQQEIYAAIGTGMKLQLISLEWSFFLDPEKFDENFERFLPTLKTVLQESTARNDEGDSDEDGKRPVKRQVSLADSTVSEKVDPVTIENPDKLWKKLYKEEMLIEWERFAADIKQMFKDQLEVLCPGEEDKEWLFTNLEREMEVEEEDKMLYKEKYLKFCLFENETNPLWQSIEGFVREMYAIQMVFAMDSTVRVDAIERLGSFQSPKVRESLRDLLHDKSANIRAVAAVSLSKTDQDKSTIKQLMKCLNDKDRLVREAGCLALGHLQAKEAVPQLLRLWRNDFISHVREAAYAALNQIGGEEVDQAMHITKVLAEEIRLLTEEG